ncbi:MAG: hypothetical protein OQJ83_13160 [Altibacter sp.]|nr:hypothetical protein [Altibacter sp.]
MHLRTHIQIALGYFLIIALLGVVLRLYQVVDVPVTYRFIVHTHSHVALLGWVYTAFSTLLYYCFLQKEPIEKKYRVIFWVTQLTIVGMMVSFPFTGYAFFSILFSTLFLLASYWFCYFFLKNVPASKKQLPSFKLIRISLWYLIISSIGPWALGAIMTTLGSSSPWYRNAIYFFLHFQYNGWFIVAICGIFFVILERYHFTFSRKAFSKFFFLLNAGVLLTFFLSVLWMNPHPVFYLLAALGGVFQLTAFGMLFLRLFKDRALLKHSLSPAVLFLLATSGVFLTVKLAAQCLGAFPLFAQRISSNIDLVISYIHWVFLGVVSIAILAFLKQFQLLRLSGFTYILYLIGFLLTEMLMFYKGVLVWTNGRLFSSYHSLLSAASLLLLIAIAILFLKQFTKKAP